LAGRCILAIVGTQTISHSKSHVIGIEVIILTITVMVTNATRMGLLSEATVLHLQIVISLANMVKQSCASTDCQLLVGNGTLLPWVASHILRTGKCSTHFSMK